MNGIVVFVFVDAQLLLNHSASVSFVSAALLSNALTVVDYAMRYVTKRGRA